MNRDRFPDRKSAIVRVVNWNLDWAAPGSKKRPEILNRIYRDHDPDIVCLTEADVRLLVDSGGHVVTSQPDGLMAKEGTALRKVVLWSREPWRCVDDRGHDGLPPGRFVAARTRTPIGEVTVMGVCIPWDGSRTKWTNDGIVRKMWEDHRRYIDVLGDLLKRAPTERFVLAGDFNQQVGQYYSAPRKHTEALHAALSERMLIATAALGFDGRRVIDQIAVSADMAAEALALISKYHAGRRLTDHVGVVADLTALSSPATNPTEGLG